MEVVLRLDTSDPKDLAALSVLFGGRMNVPSTTVAPPVAPEPEVKERKPRAKKDSPEVVGNIAPAGAPAASEPIAVAPPVATAAAPATREITDEDVTKVVEHALPILGLEWFKKLLAPTGKPKMLALTQAERPAALDAIAKALAEKEAADKAPASVL